MLLHGRAKHMRYSLLIKFDPACTMTFISCLKLSDIYSMGWLDIQTCYNQNEMSLYIHTLNVREERCKFRNTWLLFFGYPTFLEPILGLIWANIGQICGQGKTFKLEKRCWMVQMICCSGLREADAWSNSTREKGAECQSARARAGAGALTLTIF